MTSAYTLANVRSKGSDVIAVGFAGYVSQLRDCERACYRLRSRSAASTVEAVAP
jgi:hypothetical protein